MNSCDQEAEVSSLPVAKEDDEWETVAKLVRTGRWARSVFAGKLVQKPMRGRTETLLVFLWSHVTHVGGVLRVSTMLEELNELERTM